MQLMTPWRVAALAGALLWGACSKEPAPAKAPAPKPTVAAKQPAPESEAAPEAEPEQPAGAAPEAAPPAPVVDTSKPPEFKLGQKREEVMALFGTCAERRVFIPPGPGTLYVEVYQAREDPACIKYLGDRHFLIKGGFLDSISPGRMPEPKYEPIPEGV
jgi:hypothetical protein